jgi:HTH-type transcriptional regulator, glycine betaine synthesis regulator
MDRLTALFVEGMGAAAATSGILTQLQGRIFGLLYLQPRPLSLDEITDELQQSKSNVSVNVRGLVDWQLVRQIRMPGSRKDHYEAATDFWRVMQEILERRFRWNLRQVVAAAEETEGAVAGSKPSGKAAAQRAEFLTQRLSVLRDFFGAVDAGLSGFSRGESFTPQPLRRVFLTDSTESDREARDG